MQPRGEAQAVRLEGPDLLLGNRRLPRELGLKLLRSLPKHELKLVPKQTGYPTSVRTAARKLLNI